MAWDWHWIGKDWQWIGQDWNVLARIGSVGIYVFWGEGIFTDGLAVDRHLIDMDWPRIEILENWW